MMGSLRVEENGKPDILVCALYRQFPPTGHRSKVSPEELRKEGTLDQAGYDRFKVWQKVCGLSKMDETKCRGCTHCRKIEEKNSLLNLTSLDGKLSSPIVDKETFGLINREATTPVRVSNAPRFGGCR